MGSSSDKRFKKGEDGLPVGNLQSIENRLTQLENERAALTNHGANELEYEHLVIWIGQFIAPIEDDIGIAHLRGEDGRLEWAPGALAHDDGGFSMYVSMIEKKISTNTIERDKLTRSLSVAGLMGPFTSKKRHDLRCKIAQIEASEERLRKFLDVIRPLEQLTTRAHDIYASVQRLKQIGEEIELYRRALVRERRKPESQLEILRARAAATEQENRQAAARIRHSISRTERCPYCDGPLGEGHIDHIFPVSHGGRPHRWNLVYICVSCNMRKSDRTLLEFAEKYQLSYATIAKRLQGLGKRP